MQFVDIKKLLLDEAATAVTHANYLISLAQHEGVPEDTWADLWTARAAALVTAVNVLQGVYE